MNNNKFKIYVFLQCMLISVAATSKNLSKHQITDSYYKSYNYEQSGNYTDATKAILYIYKQYPNNYTVNTRLGHLYRLAGKYRNSIEHHQQALKAKPASISSKLGIQYAQILSGNYQKTLELGYQIISIDFYNYYANYRIAYALSKTKEYDLAERIINKMLAIYPDDILYMTELGLLKIKIQQIDIAKLLLNQGSLHSMSFLYHFQYEFLYYLLG